MTIIPVVPDHVPQTMHAVMQTIACNKNELGLLNELEAGFTMVFNAFNLDRHVNPQLLDRMEYRILRI